MSISKKTYRIHTLWSIFIFVFLHKLKVLGLYTFVVVDYGENFKVFDKNGDDPRPLLIENITKSNPGVVTIIKEKKHNFKTGDFVRIYDVEGNKYNYIRNERCQWC